MNLKPELVTPEFRALSARLGQDPLQVQGPGGNTSVKDQDLMWIKASGTELANAETQDIFVAVDRNKAKKAASGEGDASCKDTILDPSIKLRPSIETTFHAALDWSVVAHTHSVATLAHVISPEGRLEAKEKLADLPHVLVPYAKPGLPLTKEILARATAETQVILLQNHGLICCSDTVEAVSELMADVEARLAMPPQTVKETKPNAPTPDGFTWSDYNWLATDETAQTRSLSGTYYPDHVVFLGPALPTSNHAGNPPAIVEKGRGVLMKTDATPSQHAMLKCISDVLQRVPSDWTVEPIGEAAEAELLDWDAEKYRQALAARS